MSRSRTLQCVAAALVFLCPFASTSFATGGFGCEIDDQNLKLSASAGLGRGMGSPMLNFTGSADIVVKEISKSLRKLDLTNALSHHWIAGNELRLHFYAETAGDTPFGSAEIILMTAGAGDDLDYAGSYRLDLFTSEPPHGDGDGKSFTFEGKVTCVVE
jgi:hypothetical protein